MAIQKYHDAAGRECTVHWPPGTISEAEQNYHDCGCECQQCNEEKTMSERIGNEEVVRFTTGREATGGELSKRAAGERLVAFAKRHVAKSGGTMAEALKVAYRLNPEWVRTYLGLRRSNT